MEEAEEKRLEAERAAAAAGGAAAAAATATPTLTAAQERFQKMLFGRISFWYGSAVEQAAADMPPVTPITAVPIMKRYLGELTSFAGHTRPAGIPCPPT